MKAKITESTVRRLTLEPKPYEVVDTQLRGFILRVQPTGSKTYYYSYRNQAAKKCRIKIGSSSSLTVAQARDLAEHHAASVVKGQDVQLSKKEERQKAASIQDRTLGRFLENYYAPWVLQNKKSGTKTIDAIKRNFSHLSHLPLSKLSVLLMEQWRTQRLKDGVRPSTINRDVTALRGLVTKAVEWEAIEEHPFRRLKQLPVDTTPNVRYLSPEEEERLMAALLQRDNDLKEARARGNEFRLARNYEPLLDLYAVSYADRLIPMVLLSLKTGIRQGEAFDLRWQDISFEDNLITIRAENAKSNKTRHIPLSPLARQALENWRAQHEEVGQEQRVFPGKNGGRLDNIKRSWGSVLKDGKISSFRWHDMRHDFASKLVMKGVPLNTVRDLCGHADIATTLRYAHLAPEHKAEAIALLG
jgi:integrase